jgi:hypothetical protein
MYYLVVILSKVLVLQFRFQKIVDDHIGCCSNHAGQITLCGSVKIHKSEKRVSIRILHFAASPVPREQSAVQNCALVLGLQRQIALERSAQQHRCQCLPIASPFRRLRTGMRAG